MTAKTNGAIAEGHYARKQLVCRNRLISWSHRRRFEIARDMARPFAGLRLVDYGCGDGTFLAMLGQSDHAPAFSLGLELSDEVVNDCRRRLGQEGRIEFARIGDPQSRQHDGTFDALFCMEVMEHVCDWGPMFEAFERLLRPGGTLVISVPVEIGLALPIKLAARRVAAWRGMKDYPGEPPYTWSEWFAGVFAGDRQHFERPVQRWHDGSCSYGHKGFNWKVLRAELAKRFDFERVTGSPVVWLPTACASQAWLRLRTRMTSG